MKLSAYRCFERPLISQWNKIMVLLDHLLLRTYSRICSISLILHGIKHNSWPNVIISESFLSELIALINKINFSIYSFSEYRLACHLWYDPKPFKSEPNMNLLLPHVEHSAPPMTQRRPSFMEWPRNLCCLQLWFLHLT